MNKICVYDIHPWHANEKLVRLQHPKPVGQRVARPEKGIIIYAHNLAHSLEREES
jgi:hypothetical protein